MKLYHNVMEDLVEEVYEECVSGADCCTCERCHADTVAYALNQLPPQYAVTNAGKKLTKANNLRRQHIADIQAALARGFQVVSEFPRHEEEQ